ncbi:LysR family transcriptional regulator [Paraburkholderia sp. C35]|uniref:LysR family transcriptional regulator n=1 Tax=Paraburkholderia sp. C35 TaxID=2126993 RepID=UPI000D69D5E9|nr:LysR family transcriptional regulator [Paraburkholderia sp. C35]
MNEPDLADLKAFVAVTAARGFRNAAATGGLSASSLSEAIRRLEQQLGVRLLNRTTRSVTPTEAGQRLFERLAPAFGELATALDAINVFRDSPTGTLRLNVPSIAAREVLPALMSRFLAAHPGITVEVESNDTFIDILAAGFDAGIRYDERLERDMIAIPIGPPMQHFVAAASPAYLKRHGMPSHPDELVRHACIGHRFASGVLAVWEFTRGNETVRIVPNGPLIGSVVDMQRRAAIDGLGIAYSFDEFLRPALDDGTLVPILRDWWQSFTGPRLYYASREHMPAPLRAFVDFVLRENSSGVSA